MKLATIGMVLLAMLSASSADAWPWSRRKHPPRPIDSPIVRPKLQDQHKSGKRAGRHSARFERFSWGREEKVIVIKRAHEGHTWLFQE